MEVWVDSFWYDVQIPVTTAFWPYVPLFHAAAGNRKDKSLRIMSQKFVMLFLVSKTQTVTLDAAAKILIEESQDSSSRSKYKSKKSNRQGHKHIIIFVMLFQDNATGLLHLSFETHPIHTHSIYI